MADSDRLKRYGLMEEDVNHLLADNTFIPIYKMSKRFNKSYSMNIQSNMKLPGRRVDRTGMILEDTTETKPVMCTAGEFIGKMGRFVSSLTLRHDKQLVVASRTEADLTPSTRLTFDVLGPWPISPLVSVCSSARRGVASVAAGLDDRGHPLVHSTGVTRVLSRQTGDTGRMSVDVGGGIIVRPGKLATMARALPSAAVQVSRTDEGKTSRVTLKAAGNMMASASAVRIAGPIQAAARVNVDIPGRRIRPEAGVSIDSERIGALQMSYSGGLVMRGTRKLGQAIVGGSAFFPSMDPGQASFGISLAIDG